MTDLHLDAVAILEELSNSNNYEDRAGVARFHKTPVSILQKLATDENALVATEAKAQLYDRLTQTHEKTT